MSTDNKNLIKIAIIGFNASGKTTFLMMLYNQLHNEFGYDCMRSWAIDEESITSLFKEKCKKFKDDIKNDKEIGYFGTLAKTSLEFILRRLVLRIFNISVDNFIKLYTLDPPGEWSGKIQSGLVTQLIKGKNEKTKTNTEEINISEKAEGDPTDSSPEKAREEEFQAFIDNVKTADCIILFLDRYIEPGLAQEFYNKYKNPTPEDYKWLKSKIDKEILKNISRNINFIGQLLNLYEGKKIFINTKKPTLLICYPRLDKYQSTGNLLKNKIYSKGKALKFNFNAFGKVNLNSGLANNFFTEQIYIDGNNLQLKKHIEDRLNVGYFAFSSLKYKEDKKIDPLTALLDFCVNYNISSIILIFKGLIKGLKKHLITNFLKTLAYAIILIALILKGFVIYEYMLYMNFLKKVNSDIMILKNNKIGSIKIKEDNLDINKIYFLPQTGYFDKYRKIDGFLKNNLAEFTRQKKINNTIYKLANIKIFFIGIKNNFHRSNTLEKFSLVFNELDNYKISLQENPHNKNIYLYYLNYLEKSQFSNLNILNKEINNNLQNFINQFSYYFKDKTITKFLNYREALVYQMIYSINKLDSNNDKKKVYEKNMRYVESLNSTQARDKWYELGDVIYKKELSVILDKANRIRGYDNKIAYLSDAAYKNRDRFNDSLIRSILNQRQVNINNKLSQIYTLYDKYLFLKSMINQINRDINYFNNRNVLISFLKNKKNNIEQKMLTYANSEVVEYSNNINTYKNISQAHMFITSRYQNGYENNILKTVFDKRFLAIKNNVSSDGVQGYENFLNYVDNIINNLYNERYIWSDQYVVQQINYLKKVKVFYSLVKEEKDIFSSPSVSGIDRLIEIKNILNTNTYSKNIPNNFIRQIISEIDSHEFAIFIEKLNFIDLDFKEFRITRSGINKGDKPDMQPCIKIGSDYWYGDKKENISQNNVSWAVNKVFKWKIGEYILVEFKDKRSYGLFFGTKNENLYKTKIDGVNSIKKINSNKEIGLNIWNFHEKDWQGSNKSKISFQWRIQ